MTSKVIVIDTSAFFAATENLKGVVARQEGREVSLVTLDLMIFEFLKVIEQEIDGAKGKGNLRRVKILQSLSERFPKLLDEFAIEIKTGTDLTLEDITETYSLISRGHESGDSIIWIKMQKLGFETILTDDLGHWRSLGADVLSVTPTPRKQ